MEGLRRESLGGSGIVLDGRYSVCDKLGSGSYGHVFKAVDRVENEFVAVKISVDSCIYKRRDLHEGEVFDIIARSSSSLKSYTVSYKRSFMCRDRLCFVLELLDYSLEDLIRIRFFQTNSLGLLSYYTRELLKALKFLSDTDIIHCDLKPSNILMSKMGYLDVKLIDFGLSCGSFAPQLPLVQATGYRSPEVVLRLPYSKAIDMWSIGCILVECVTGKMLFDVDNEISLMELITDILGMTPDEMIESSRVGQKYFHLDEGSDKWIHRDSSNTVAASLLRTHLFKFKDSTANDSCFNTFVDLVEKMLVIDPNVRIAPDEALRHAFLSYAVC